MTYIKLDDTCPDHPSIVGLSDPAFACWVRCLCYASRHLTDGRIPTVAMRTMGTPKAVKELVGRGRLAEVDGEYEVHGYTERQRTRDQVESQREGWRKRQAKARITPMSQRDNGVSHERVTRPEVEEREEQQQHTPTVTPAEHRRNLLAAAAAIIGGRAAQRPGVRDPAATTAAVARGVVADRCRDAFAHIAAHPGVTPEQLADHLEPAPVAPTVPVRPPMPTHTPDEIADFGPVAPLRMPEDTRTAGLATIVALKRQGPDQDPAA